MKSRQRLISSEPGLFLPRRAQPSLSQFEGSTFDRRVVRQPDQIVNGRRLTRVSFRHVIAGDGGLDFVAEPLVNRRVAIGEGHSAGATMETGWSIYNETSGSSRHRHLVAKISVIQAVRMFVNQNPCLGDIHDLRSLSVRPVSGETNSREKAAVGEDVAHR